jgi:hypothetical protein
MSIQIPDLPPHFEKFLNALFENVNNKIDALTKLIEGLNGTNKSCVERCRGEMDGVYDRLRAVEREQGIHVRRLDDHDEELKEMRNDAKAETKSRETEASQWSQAHAGWLNAATSIMVLFFMIYSLFFK